MGLHSLLSGGESHGLHSLLSGGESHGLHSLLSGGESHGPPLATEWRGESWASTRY